MSSFSRAKIYVCIFVVGCTFEISNFLHNKLFIKLDFPDENPPPKAIIPLLSNGGNNINLDK